MQARVRGRTRIEQMGLSVVPCPGAKIWIWIMKYDSLEAQFKAARTASKFATSPHNKHARHCDQRRSIEVNYNPGKLVARRVESLRPKSRSVQNTTLQDGAKYALPWSDWLQGRCTDPRYCSNPPVKRGWACWTLCFLEGPQRTPFS